MSLDKELSTSTSRGEALTPINKQTSKKSKRSPLLTFRGPQPLIENPEAPVPAEQPQVKPPLSVELTEQIAQLRQLLLSELKQLEDSKQAIEAIIKENNTDRLWYYADIYRMYQSSIHHLSQSHEYLNFITDRKIIEEHFSDGLKTLKQIENTCSDIKTLHDNYYTTYIQLKRPNIPDFNPKTRWKFKQWIASAALIMVAVIGLLILAAVQISLVILGSTVVAATTLVATSLTLLTGIARFVYKKITAPKKPQLPDLSALFGQQVPVCIKPNLGIAKQDRTAKSQLDHVCSDSEIEPGKAIASPSEIEVTKLRMQLFKEFSEFNQALYDLKNFQSRSVDDHVITMLKNGHELHKEFRDTFLSANDTAPYDADTLLKWQEIITQETAKFKQAISPQQRPSLRA